MSSGFSVLITDFVGDFVGDGVELLSSNARKGLSAIVDDLRLVSSVKIVRSSENRGLAVEF